MSRFSGRLAIARALLAPQRLAALSSRRRPERVRRVLIAHHLLLGDTLMLTPLLAKLRAQHPAAEVDLTVPAATAPLYTTRPYGVNALPWSPRESASVRRLLDIGTRAGGYDLAIVPGDNRHAWLARAMGARWIIAHAGDRPAYKSWLVDEARPYSDTPGAWGDLVAQLVDGPPPPPYQATDWPAPPAAPFDCPAAPYAVLHLGASSPLKTWPAERWQALAARLVAAGLTPVWSGGRGEEKLVAAVDPGQHHRSYAGQLDLAQLWQLLAGAALLVCPDTGVAHLGRLTGTPTLTLFGPGSAVICGAGDFWRHAPYQALSETPYPCRNQHVLFRREIGWVQRCGRGFRSGAPRDDRHCPEAGCMNALTVEAAWTAAATLLAARRERTLG